MAPRFAVLLALVAGCYQSHGLFGGPCERTEDCPESPVGCAQAFCSDGFCELIPIPDSCSPDETCDFTRGCVGPDARRDVPSFDAGPRDAPFDVLPLPDVPFRPDVPVLDVPFRPDTPIPFDAPFRPDVPLRPDAPVLDVPRDTPIPLPDVPVRDVPVLDVPRDVPRDVPTDAPLPTSLARQCRPDSVMTMLDHPAFSSFDTTLELWVRVRGPGMIARKGEGERRHYDLSIVRRVDGGLSLRGAWGTEATETIVDVPIDAHVGRWAHVALVHRTGASGGVTLELYVNATLVGSGPISGALSDAFNTQAFLFCSFDGDVDDIRFWGGALDAGLIEARRFGPIPPDTAGLQAYWPLDTRGQVIFDRTLHGADGVAGTVSTPDPRDPATITDGAF